jgi:hypothetical protein
MITHCSNLDKPVAVECKMKETRDKDEMQIGTWPLSRRRFLALTNLAVGAMACGTTKTASRLVKGKTIRTFHLCTNPDSLDAEPDRLAIYRDAGVSTVWLPAFFYGYWPYSTERLRYWCKRIESMGMASAMANIPLGHPGDSLGAKSDQFPLTPPEHWHMAQRPEGIVYAGTSLHKPATEENVQAMRILRDMGVSQVFLDDDFRLAPGPGSIGGCFCAEHKKDFLLKYGFAESTWTELLAAVHDRSLTPVLRSWIEYTCDQLTECFRAQQAAAPDIALGNMVMFFGSEKAGIRLQDYRNAPLRVGELMFKDSSFVQVKNKTAELYSCLFHRRYVVPELAYSETTAFPADKLSAANMAAKLAVSTISDVRHTMFMSGLTPFPREHWPVLSPAMKKHAAIHAVIAGQVPQGPYKHYWGERERYVGDDNPFSLFLASGVPFEVTGKPARDGWTFLANYDARAVSENQLKSNGTTFVVRQSISGHSGLQVVEENLSALFAFKKQLLPHFNEIPYVAEEKPVVCTWYPKIHSVLLWNLAEQNEEFTVVYRNSRRSVQIAALDVELMTDLH